MIRIELQVELSADFAHLMMALCRAVSMPARFVTGTDYVLPPDRTVRYRTDYAQPHA
jgi:transglutaminase-like putative cysteine protease